MYCTFNVADLLLLCEDSSYEEFITSLIEYYLAGVRAYSYELSVIQYIVVVMQPLNMKTNGKVLCNH